MSHRFVVAIAVAIAAVSLVWTGWLGFSVGKLQQVMLPPPVTTSCTLGLVGTAMIETWAGPIGTVACDTWAATYPRLVYLADEPTDSEHHVLCRFAAHGVTVTVRDTGMGLYGNQRCQQLAKWAIP